jgi:hypothetical protein
MKSDPRKNTEEFTRPGDSSSVEEVEHYDDATVGKAFRWSAVALLIVVVAVGIGIISLP